ncbi:hypothetical protein NG895_05690 [Aeoliella sp. ICT_H6.2]|uniref:Uncharacterized protein n=1 Tax=Aeoliella straminimaris TaxID=2954799 RepID=A0A9X2JGD1_9BACT|nr:hypothetical protein [Aeoliella straminimaris]MCO6043393.1 hypothetical protein [Aeoliella straminimaris]
MKGRRNKKAAEAKLKTLLAESDLLATVDGAISVAGLGEEFLTDAREHLAPKTYDSYLYSRQMLIDEVGEQKTLTVNSAVHDYLVKISERDGVTHNEILEDVLSRAWRGSRHIGQGRGRGR